MDTFHSLLRRLNDRGRFGVLATLMSAEGHAYRKPGAAMLLGKNGVSAGQISPGCIEDDLAERAAEAAALGRSIVAEYDVREPDDMNYGENVGCGGLLRVLLEPMDSVLEQALQAVERALDEGWPATLVRMIEPGGNVTEYRVRYGDGWHERFARAGEASGGHPARMSHRYEPNPRLLLFGAGADAVPVAELAARAGFEVIVADRREALCAKARFPSASAVVTGTVDGMIKQMAVRRGDRAVVMTHQMQQDRAVLELLAASPISFIGLLGSQIRIKRLIEGLFHPGDPRLSAPVGILPAVDGAQRIAISIVAELLDELRRDAAAVLERPVHHRNHA